MGMFLAGDVRSGSRALIVGSSIELYVHVFVFFPALNCMFIFCILQVRGQAGGGSFKFETLIAYRAEQRLCL